MSGTSPDSVGYPQQNYGVLGPLPAYVINLQDVPGADPTGNDDSTLAINTALASLPADGGELIIAPGIYKISGNLTAKSNTVISGSGVLKAAPIAEWQGSPYYGITNVNNDASEITDENITISGITIDYTDFPSADGTRHCIFLRKVRGVKIHRVKTIHGSSAIALLGCDDTEEIGNTLKGFTNCGSDHWDQPNNTRVIGCHIETDYANVQQMMNYNPDNVPGASSGFVAKNFVFVGNTVINTASSTIGCVVAPLDANQTVENVTISNNIFSNTFLVVRGGVIGATISNNIFKDFRSGSEAILGYTRLGKTPENVIITGNIVFDAITSVGNLGVIRMESDTATIAFNEVKGTGYACAPFYVGSTAGQMFGNQSDGTTVPGYLQTGMRLRNGTANYYAWTDASGGVPRMYVQSDNNWIFHGTSSTGTQRTILSAYMHSDLSELTAGIPVVFSDSFRTPVASVAATGTTIGGAANVSGNVTQVTSATVGVNDGVRLLPTTGKPQTVINVTAVTIKVYPNASGTAQIDAGGASTPTTILAGKSKTFVQVVADDFRTIATS